jgi:NMD protein affecting ribosome stability and mRNA decay
MKKDTRKFGISDKRGRQQTNLDPFMPQEGLKEPSLCTSCKTVYQHKHWAFDPEEYQKLKTDPKVNRISCPACQKIAAGYPEGIVTLSGSYLWKHEREIQQIIKNEEHKALAKNPFERIIRRHREEDTLVIETTEKKLAEHLGRVLNKAHQGDLNISWTGDPDICRVSWKRML